MSTHTTIESAESSSSNRDPYALGWRYVRRVSPDGDVYSEKVGLTEHDILHPQEGDFIVNHDLHNQLIFQLLSVFKIHFRHRSDTRVFSDHRIDWQHPDIEPLGPDLIVLGNMTKPWDPMRGTFPLKTQGAETLLVVEIASPTTRKNDFGVKFEFYHTLGVPYYLIVDKVTTDDDIQVYCHKRTPEGYVRLPTVEGRGVWIPSVELWIGSGQYQLICRDKNLKVLSDVVELSHELDAEKLRAEAEKLRAEAEKQRAEAEKQRAEAEKLRAEAEKQRAETLATELAVLKARLDGNTSKE